MLFSHCARSSKRSDHSGKSGCGFLGLGQRTGSSNYDKPINCQRFSWRTFTSFDKHMNKQQMFAWKHSQKMRWWFHTSRMVSAHSINSRNYPEWKKRSHNNCWHFYGLTEWKISKVNLNYMPSVTVVSANQTDYELYEFHQRLKMPFLFVFFKRFGNVPFSFSFGWRKYRRRQKSVQLLRVAPILHTFSHCVLNCCKLHFYPFAKMPCQWLCPAQTHQAQFPYFNSKENRPATNSVLTKKKQPDSYFCSQRQIN